MQQLHKQKETFHKQYKDYRNMLSALLKKSLKKLLQPIFQSHHEQCSNYFNNTKSIIIVKIFLIFQRVYLQ